MAELDRFESLAERRLREAAERGEFNGLPGAGRPIQGLDRPYDPAWWAKELVERERLAEAARAQRAEIDGKLAHLWPLRSISQVRLRVAELNQELEALGADLLDTDEIVALWRRFAIYRRD